MASQATPADHELFLEVELNGVRATGLTPFHLSAAGLVADPQILRNLGLRWPGSDTAVGPVRLSDVPGLTARLDTRAQRVQIQADVDLLARPLQRLPAADPRLTSLAPTDRVAGLVLNYDLFADVGAGQAGVNGWGELRLLGVGPGTWSHSGVTRLRGAPHSQNDSVRLETSWQYDWPEQMVSLVAGDTVTTPLSWTRSMRIGGIRLGRRFALQPYRVTAPLANMYGEAALPSKVELFVNGLRQWSQEVQPGRFMIDGIPSLGGAGTAHVVLTDINGQGRTVSLDFYGAPQLLQQGLWDWSIEGGFVRRGYGLASSDYSRGFAASGVARFGQSDTATVEAALQWSRDVQLAGGGVVWLIGGDLGVVTASLAAGRSREGMGWQRSIGIQRTAADHSIAATSLRRSHLYRDLGSAFDHEAVIGMDTFFAGARTQLGYFGLSHVRQAIFGNRPRRYHTLSWSARGPWSSTIGLTATRVSGTQVRTRLQATWAIPLGSRRMVSTSVAVAARRATFVADATQPESESGAWGWRLQASGGGADAGAAASAQVSRSFRGGALSLGLTRSARDAIAGHAAFNGALVLADGALYSSRRIDDAFALVTTSGEPDVPVRLENRLIGRTDADGRLLVPQLNAYQRNRVTIDTLQLAAHVRAERVQADIVPPQRGGAIARFPLRHVVAVHAVLIGEDGRYLPVGSGLYRDRSTMGSGDPLAVVGHDGLIYLEDPPAGATFQVETGKGTCDLILPPILQTGLADLGTVVCRH